MLKIGLLCTIYKGRLAECYRAQLYLWNKLSKALGLWKLYAVRNCIHQAMGSDEMFDLDRNQDSLKCSFLLITCTGIRIPESPSLNRKSLVKVPMHRRSQASATSPSSWRQPSGQRICTVHKFPVVQLKDKHQFHTFIISWYGRFANVLGRFVLLHLGRKLVMDQLIFNDMAVAWYALRTLGLRCYFLLGVSSVKK